MPFLAITLTDSLKYISIYVIPAVSLIFKKKMLLRLTINSRRESFGYYADEIEAAKAYYYSLY